MPRLKLAIVLLIVSLVGTAVLSVWFRNEILRVAHETEAFQEKKRDLLQAQRELIVGIEQLRSLERIEEIAIGQMGMKRPEQDQQVYVSAKGAIVEGKKEPSPSPIFSKR